MDLRTCGRVGVECAGWPEERVLVTTQTSLLPAAAVPPLQSLTYLSIVHVLYARYPAAEIAPVCLWVGPQRASAQVSGFREKVGCGKR